VKKFKDIRAGSFFLYGCKVYLKEDNDRGTYGRALEIDPHTCVLQCNIASDAFVFPVVATFVATVSVTIGE